MVEVFLIEESRALRRVLTAQLRDAGFNVTSFDGFAPADIELFSAADIVVTEIMVPTGRGDEVVSNLRNSFPALPVIAMTGAEISNLDELDVFGKLQKPFSETELVDLVQRAMRGHEQAKPNGQMPLSKAS